MPAPSIGLFYCLNKNIAGLPFDTQCVVTVFKQAQPFRIEVQDIWSGRTYVAKFSNDTVNGFVEYALKSDLNAKTPTCQERHMTADTQTLSSDSATTLGDSEITIPFDCIMIGNWKVLCKSSDANASFYYMVNTAYVQGRVQWDGTVQTDNTVNIFVMNRFTKGQKLSVSVQGNCSVRGNNTSLTRYTFTFIPV